MVSERNPKELNWLKDKYISKIETIEKAKSFSTKPGVLCQWCEYLTVCSDGKAWVEKRKKKSDRKEATEPVPSAAAVEAVKGPLVVPTLAEKPITPLVPAAFPPISVVADLKPKHKKPSRGLVSPDQLSLFK